MILVGITPGEGRLGGGALRDAVAAALAAGIDRVVVREGGIPDEVLDRLAGSADRLVLHARMPGAQAAATARGMGLHLPGGADVEGVRGGFPGVLGYSAHDPDEARAALAAGATYVFLSPIWRAGSKPGDERRPLGADALRGTGAVALGGVTPERVAACRAAGAAGVAALGGIFLADDVAAAVTRYRRALG